MKTDNCGPWCKPLVMVHNVHFLCLCKGVLIRGCRPPPHPLQCIHSEWSCSQEPQTLWPMWSSWRSAYWGPPLVPPGGPGTWTALAKPQGWRHREGVRVTHKYQVMVAKMKEGERRRNIPWRAISAASRNSRSTSKLAALNSANLA